MGLNDLRETTRSSDEAKEGMSRCTDVGRSTDRLPLGDNVCSALLVETLSSTSVASGSGDSPSMYETSGGGDGEIGTVLDDVGPVSLEVGTS